MSGYGSNKSPWDNNRGLNMGYGQQAGGGMVQPGISMQQATSMAGLGGMNQGMSVSYPTPRANQASGGGGGMYGAMQQAQTGMQAAPAMMGQNSQNNRVFTGTVTKLHDNFGFVDDDVFFQVAVVKGQPPRVGDRVLVEAVYNANMPFKWNATRITPIPAAGTGVGLVGNNQPTRGFGDRGFVDRGFVDRGDRNRDRNRQTRSPRRDDRKREERERSSRKRSRTKSKSRTRSPPRRKARNQPRYNVSVPKCSLNFPSSNVMELRKRYSSLYIPSDFFTAKHVWNEAFPIEAPFNVSFPSAFHVFNKELVDPVAHNKFQYDPADSDYSYVAKVMLLASPNLEELYEKTCHLIEKDSEDKDPRENLIHPTRALKFLVGLKGKSETMAIGGPWSPSLDGADPKNDPSVLIKTAIRTCGAMTGIDLSNCTQWTRFIEIYYRRQATVTKPARTETVVVFFPDVWAAMPNKIDYDATCELYARNSQLRQEGKSVKLPEVEATDMDASGVEEDAEEGDEAAVAKGDPTHWKDLDPKTMKVNDLKSELEARGQSSKGLKSQLQARLQKLLQSEEEAEEKKNVDGEPMEEEKPENKENEAEETVKELDEKTKEKIKNAYKTSTSPCFLVHPNNKVKSGKFDCRVESLSVLLDYRSDDNKEGTYEISLFAELFNEMLMRDHAFQIYKSVVNAPEKPKDANKDDKKEDKKDDREEEKMEDEEEEKKNMISRNKELLLSCSYFDLSHTGYFEAKDLEDIFLSMELELSRAEVKKLSLKLAGARDHVNYRPMVDVEVGAPEQDVETAGAKSDKELASGFKQYVPGTEGGTAAAPSSLETNKLVKFRGSVLDIEKLVEKLDKAERVRTTTESRLVSIQKELSSCKEQSDRFLAQRDKLTADLKASRDKTRILEGELMMSKGEAAKYLAALKDVLYRVQPLAAPPKTEEVPAIPKINGVEDVAMKEDLSKEEVKDEEPKPEAAESDTAAAVDS